MCDSRSNPLRLRYLSALMSVVGKSTCAPLNGRRILKSTMRGQSLPALGSLTEERMEVEAVLRSGIFDRAPGLEQLFIYITSKFLEGSADDIKEYNIAVEAFGRGADFDQSRDSIVRVQAHRLRERLAEYYLSEGRSHLVQIEIPNGRYTPKFRFAAPDAATSPIAPPEEANGVLALTQHQVVRLEQP